MYFKKIRENRFWRKNKRKIEICKFAFTIASLLQHHLDKFWLIVCRFVFIFRWRFDWLGHWFWLCARLYLGFWWFRFVLFNRIDVIWALIVSRWLCWSCFGELLFLPPFWRDVFNWHNFLIYLSLVQWMTSAKIEFKVILVTALVELAADWLAWHPLLYFRIITI